MYRFAGCIWALVVVLPWKAVAASVSLHGGIRFRAALSSQLRTGTDTGNPTV